MSQVTKETIKDIAKLARVNLSGSEEKKAVEDLNGIFDHFSKIQKIDTKDVPTSDDVTGQTNVWREDVAQPETLCSHDELLDRAPATHKRQVKVKAVL